MVRACRYVRARVCVIDIELIRPSAAPQLSSAAETSATGGLPTSDFDKKYEEFASSLKLELDNEKPFSVVIGKIDDIEQAVKNINLINVKNLPV
jgi:hypothetical protein